MLYSQVCAFSSLIQGLEVITLEDSLHLHLMSETHQALIEKSHQCALVLEEYTRAHLISSSKKTRNSCKAIHPIYRLLKDGTLHPKGMREGMSFEKEKQKTLCEQGFIVSANSLSLSFHGRTRILRVNSRGHF